MKRLAIALLLAMGVAAIPFSGEAAAATRKKVAVAKKHVPAKNIAKASRGKSKAAPSSKHVQHLQHARQIALDETGDLVLQSGAAVVLDQSNGAVLIEKNASVQVPIASITKLMTAMVALDARPNLAEELAISEDDVDTLKGTRSRLIVGTRLTREEMLRLALMASENRAAAALSRHYPGGRPAFIAAMNQKAMELGLTDTHFEDSTGLTAANVSSARDLTKMVAAAHRYPLIRQYSTTPEYEVNVAGRPRAFHNTNSLVRSETWEIGLSKTGYISEAGRCLVMQAWVRDKPMIIVLLDSWGKFTRIGDANRIKRWIESASLPQRSVAG
jgi:D-alanyl-D-alanine endopeptidase (penicillin-binding protein 7)